MRTEALVYPDPRAACFYARRALELAVEWLYKADGRLTLPYQETLAALLAEPSFQTLATPRIAAKARLIKDHGNRAVHTQKIITQYDALIACRELFEFGYWLASHYARSPRRPRVSQSCSLRQWQVQALLGHRRHWLYSSHNRPTAPKLPAHLCHAPKGRNHFSHATRVHRHRPFRDFGRRCDFSANCAHTGTKRITFGNPAADICDCGGSAEHTLSAAARGSGDWPSADECAHGPSKCRETLVGRWTFILLGAPAGNQAPIPIWLAGVELAFVATDSFARAL